MNIKIGYAGVIEGRMPKLIQQVNWHSKDEIICDFHVNTFKCIAWPHLEKWNSVAIFKVTPKDNRTNALQTL